MTGSTTQPLASMIVSRHHEWRGPASYKPEDRGTCICMDCGVKWKVGRQDHRRLPRCKPKVEHISSGYRGFPLHLWMAGHRKWPDRYPNPSGVFRITSLKNGG